MLTKSKFNAYFRLMRADKPVGIYLLLWPTCWALIIASQGFPSLDMLTIFLLGVVVMRSAGCVINDYADRHVDGDVARTKLRPIVTGEVSEREALFLFSSLIFIAFILVLMLNIETIILSIGGLALAVLYPFMKRYTHFPQVVLGAAFSWGIPMAFMAINGQITWVAWALYAANLLWTVAYDTQYAMVDREDDIKIGVKSTAVLFGQMDRPIIGILQMLMLGLLFLVSYALQFSWPVYAALVAAAGLFVYQQVLVWHREPDKCFKAFLNSHYAGMFFAFGLIIHYAL